MSDRDASQPTTATDHWAAWLAERRHGGDREFLRQTLEFLGPIRDRVIASADVSTGARVLDVGCGDGLIAFAALDKVGPSGEVIFSDISSDLLERCRELARAADALERCHFAHASATELSAIEDASVDAVTLRSVLIYEKDKAGAFREFHRVLRPGGRLSLFEPVNRFGWPEPADRFCGYDVEAVAEIASKVKAVYESRQPQATDPMLDFDERDLLSLAEGAGFSEVHLSLDVDIEAYSASPWQTSWEAWLHSAPNPLVPMRAEAMSEALSPAEAQRLSDHLRPLVEAGQGQVRRAAAYIWSVR